MTGFFDSMSGIRGGKVLIYKTKRMARLRPYTEKFAHSWLRLSTETMRPLQFQTQNVCAYVKEKKRRQLCHCSNKKSQISKQKEEKED